MANGDLDPNLFNPTPAMGRPGLTPGATGALATPPGPASGADAKMVARARALQAQTDLALAAGRREQELYAQKQKALAPLYDEQRAASRRLTQVSEAETQRFLASQQPIPQYQEPDLRTAAGAWMMAAAGFGAIIGRHGASYNTAALDGFAGMLNGFNKGSLDAITVNYKTWETNAKRAEALNAQALDRYKKVIDNAALNWDQKAAMIKATADQYQDMIMASAAEQKNITQMMELFDKQDRFRETMQFHREQLGLGMDKLDAQLAQNGLKRNLDTGKVEMDDSEGSPFYARAKAIAEYKQAPIAGARGGAAMLMGLVQKINPNYDATKWTGATAYARTAGGYAANVEMATNEVSYFIPQALQASAKVPRGNWVPVNEIKNKWRQYHSDPNYADLVAANTSLLSAYSRAINPRGVPRIAEKMAAKEELLNLASSPEVYKTVLRRMALEVRASHAAVAKTRGQADAETKEIVSIMDMSDAQLNTYIANNGVNTEGSSALRAATPGSEGAPGGPAAPPTMPDFSQFEVLPP